MLCQLQGIQGIGGIAPFDLVFHIWYFHLELLLFFWAALILWIECEVEALWPGLRIGQNVTVVLRCLLLILLLLLFDHWWLGAASLIASVRSPGLREGNFVSTGQRLQALTLRVLPALDSIQIIQDCDLLLLLA